MKVNCSVNTQSHWKKIKCPFFKSDNFNSISCEGCVDKSYIRHAFNSRFVKDDWQDKYCMRIDMFKKCPIYSAANEKYD